MKTTPTSNAQRIGGCHLETVNSQIYKPLIIEDLELNFVSTFTDYYEGIDMERGLELVLMASRNRIMCLIFLTWITQEPLRPKKFECCHRSLRI